MQTRPPFARKNDDGRDRHASRGARGPLTHGGAGLRRRVPAHDRGADHGGDSGGGIRHRNDHEQFCIIRRDDDRLLRRGRRGGGHPASRLGQAAGHHGLTRFRVRKAGKVLTIRWSRRREDTSISLPSSSLGTQRAVVAGRCTTASEASTRHFLTSARTRPNTCHRRYLIAQRVFFASCEVAKQGRAPVRHADEPSGLLWVLSWRGQLLCCNAHSHLNGRHPRSVNAYNEPVPFELAGRPPRGLRRPSITRGYAPGLIRSFSPCLRM
jgi:hypothetical protein